jgi:D-serine deaminase-like pyridoxal phosphate-dependent protein
MITTTRPEISIDDYRIDRPDTVLSPGLVVFRDLVDQNLEAMIGIAGGPDRLRPHCKTHKMPALITRMRESGITRHKCATIAEAEMLCRAGVGDILIAYQMVGPNIGRLANLMDHYPDARFTVLIDHPAPLEALAATMQQHQRTVAVLLDVDSGMGRTGIAAGPDARQLYEMVCSSPGIDAAGLHWYDGHNRQSGRDDRKTAIEGGWQSVVQLRDSLLLDGFPIPGLVAAGTGSFPILAEIGEPNLQLTPGTTTLYDAGYHELFPDLPFRPAAAVLTRVVSCNRSGHLTLDCGHKSLAPDQPAGHRAVFPELPDAKEVAHTEEHLVIATDLASHYQPGDTLLALPRHICPTVALHQSATVVSDGKIVDTWAVVSRDRVLTV